MSVREEIAKNLIYYRKKAGLTQKELADKLGVKNSAVSNWEQGLNSIDIDTLMKVCEIFNISFDVISGRVHEQTTNTSVVAIARGGEKVQYDLTEAEMQAVLTILDGIKKGKK